jgi:putative DNA primase/helicase
LDRIPLLFNCQNGILNLEDLKTRKTCGILPHEQSQLLGLISPVSYDPLAPYPEFQRFLERIIPEIKVRKFLQRLAGYSLTGLTSEHCFFIFYGKGRNGKSTFVETMMFVLGRYARTANGDTFLSGRRTGAVRDDLHALRGARMVKAVETGKNARLDEPTVKEHTGGDTVATRALYGQQTEWKPNHKLILVSNEKPHIHGTDEGIWSRVRMVPFTVTIPAEECIPDFFQDRLMPEASGILNWALEGLREYFKGGLAAPPEVLEATKAYREEENVVQQFLDARCVVTRDAKVSKDASKIWASPDGLQAAFRDWCEGQGINHRSTKLKETLEQLGYRQERGHGGRYWLGIETTKIQSPISSYR